MEQITVNMYFNMVQHLDFRSKLELISMISNSLLNSTLKSTEDKEQLLKGAFGGFVGIIIKKSLYPESNRRPLAY